MHLLHARDRRSANHDMTEATLSPEFLARMDEAIAEEFERSSRLRKILPAEVDMPHARYGVVVPRVVDDASTASASATTDVLRPPITLQREIRISARQLEDLDLVLNLVRDATKRIAAAEDQIIAYGGLLLLTGSGPPGVQIEGLLERTEGLFGPGSKVDPIEPQPLPPEPGGRLTAVVQEATSLLDLHDPAFHAPYAAALAPPAWRIYVPSDDDDDKKAIVAALQSRSFAPVNGRDLKCPQKEESAITTLLTKIETEIAAGADVDAVKQGVSDLLATAVARPDLHPLTKSRMRAIVDAVLAAAEESLSPTRFEALEVESAAMKTAAAKEVKAGTVSIGGAGPSGAVSITDALIKDATIDRMSLRGVSLTRGIADIKANLLDALRSAAYAGEQIDVCPKPFVSVFSSDPVDLDLARVRRSWGSFRGYDDAGNVRYVVENQFLLRLKRGAALCAVWVTGFDADHQPNAFQRLSVDEGL